MKSLFYRFFAQGMFISILSLIAFNTQAQAPTKKKKKCADCNTSSPQAGQFKKGEFFFQWGYNRSAYSASDIHFKGTGIDFTLSNIGAKDRPTPFNFNDYFVNITIPQFVAQAGYFFKDNWSINIGTDHMKYVMNPNQQSTITGTIDSNAVTAAYAGSYDKTPITVSTNLLRFEHTNGLNYVFSSLEYYHVLWDAKKGPCKLTVVPGFSLAVMYPRSDVDLFNEEGSNVFHVAGWGTGLHGGLRFNILKNLYVLWNNKAGFIHMPNILCDINKYDASQHFFYFQTAFSLGYNFRF